ncbi:hypothetical protein C4544_00825 [candidate division WS5 bacterium]|uniref:Linalool dehydratase/isomerase domain-containing protein n=1 Tax=candidate division WS5 bacterium TaxID=2093353 RepID=A0A419DFZ3_9BACT|nr:MAG: hypothetical protein C4544_00825 [candidate division WS5 bacterium]
MPSLEVKEKANLGSAYKKALNLLEESYKNGRIFSHLPKDNVPLSWFEPLCIPAMPPALRKEAIKKYLHEGKILNIATTGMMAWAIINILEDYSTDEKVLLEEYFTKCDEYFDCKLTAEGLLPTGLEGNWLVSADRQGILVENQAYYGKLLDLLFLLTDDDLYEFKKKRLIGAVRNKLDGAYVLDREDAMEIRPNSFIAAFLAPELFKRSDWKKTFDTFVKSDALWLDWGGLSTIAVDNIGKSWFFINNMAAIALYRLDGLKYFEKINRIVNASAKNVLWQEHSGRPCEVTLDSDGKIQVQGLYSISLATFIYLYRITQDD